MPATTGASLYTMNIIKARIFFAAENSILRLYLQAEISKTEILSHTILR
jgi:hypothetical protein